jgi:hypothetical protein
MPHQVHGALLHAVSGTELSRVRTELRLLPPEPINQSLLVSRWASIVMQSSGPSPHLVVSSMRTDKCAMPESHFRGLNSALET